MASIYESPGQQVELTGFQSTSSTPLVQAYDPSGIMLQQSEKDLEALAKFSDTLGGILKKKKEEIKNETIAKGFTKFVTGEIVYNADTNEFRQQEALVEKAAANATAPIHDGIQIQQTPKQYAKAVLPFHQYQCALELYTKESNLLS